MIDLNNIASYQENNRIEAKKAAGGFPHSLWETYSAFANTIGGLILLGVEERADKSLRITGVPDGPGYARVFWQTVQDPAKVSQNILRPEDVALHQVEGKEILVISVPRATRRQRPVYIGDSPFTGSYRRDGEGDYHCSADEVRAMLRDRDDAPADLAVLSGRNRSDLSSDTLRQFRLLMAMRQPDHPGNYLPDERFLPAVGITGPEGLHPTLAGLLLLGKRKALREVFPQFRLEYQEEDTGFHLATIRPGAPENVFSFYMMVSHRLTAVSALLAQTPREREELAGAMREAVLNAILHADYFSRGGLTIRRRAGELLVSNGGLLRVSPDQARTGQAADPRNRGLIQLFSLVKLAGAMREAVLNAILHADYFSRGGLTIRRRAGELLVSNGGLLRVSPDQARTGQAADPRNRGLIQLFSLVKLATGTGKGLRGIYSLWDRRGWRPPVLSETFSADRTDLSLPLPPREFSAEELTRQQVIEYLTDHVTAGVKTLAQGLGLSEEEIQGALDQLMGRDLVVRAGRGYRLRA